MRANVRAMAVACISWICLLITLVHKAITLISANGDVGMSHTHHVNKNVAKMFLSDLLKSLSIHAILSIYTPNSGEDKILQE